VRLSFVMHVLKGSHEVIAEYGIKPDRLAPACDKRRMQKAWTGIRGAVWSVAIGIASPRGCRHAGSTDRLGLR